MQHVKAAAAAANASRTEEDLLLVIAHYQQHKQVLKVQANRVARAAPCRERVVVEDDFPLVSGHDGTADVFHSQLQSLNLPPPNVLPVPQTLEPTPNDVPPPQTPKTSDNQNWAVQFKMEEEMWLQLAEQDERRNDLQKIIEMAANARAADADDWRILDRFEKHKLEQNPEIGQDIQTAHNTESQKDRPVDMSLRLNMDFMDLQDSRIAEAQIAFEQDLEHELMVTKMKKTEVRKFQRPASALPSTNVEQRQKYSMPDLQLAGAEGASSARANFCDGLNERFKELAAVCVLCVCLCVCVEVCVCVCVLFIAHCYVCVPSCY